MKLYCPNCGNKMNTNEINCSACGQNNPLYGKKIETDHINNNNYDDIDEQKILQSATALGIISILLSFSMPIIGIILASIGLKKANKIPSEKRSHSTVKVVNNIGLILSIVFFSIVVILGCIMVSFILRQNNLTSTDENTFIVGTYNCQNGTSSIDSKDYVITFRLEDNKNFTIGAYKEESENTISGTYTFTNSKNNESSEYKYYAITLNGYQKGININGAIQRKPYYSKVEFGIREKNNHNEGILSFENGNIYYCFAE